MTGRVPGRAVASAAIFLLVSCGIVRGEEGMWLPDHPPLRAWRETYGFEPDPAWLDRIRLSCVRLAGASGALVSPDGLVLTNHHVGFDYIQERSAPGRDLLRDGFLAATPEQELPCPGLEAQILRSIEDVTARIREAVPAGTDPAEARAARQRAMTRLEEDAHRQTGLDCCLLYTSPSP
ncbi:MAG: S46 family peptidase, partial [Candidatus Eisenbacteria bacterium]|nr:S46 family peptidase [Candidatus Eisenbacteria bacterium]